MTFTFSADAEGRKGMTRVTRPNFAPLNNVVINL